MKRNSLYLSTALSLALHLLLFLVLPEGQDSDVDQPVPLRVGLVRPTDETMVASSEKSVSSESSSSEDSDSIKKEPSPPRTNAEISPEPDKQAPSPSPSHIPDDRPTAVNQDPPESVEQVEIEPEPPARRQVVISKQRLVHPEGTGFSESDSPGEMQSEPSLGSRASSSGVEQVRAAPDYAVNPPPRYPYSARKRGWEGTVLVRVLVSTSGRALEASVENSSGYTLLDRSALKAVRQWMFHPGKRGDIAVKSEVLVPVIFRMES